jgi:hypothetical protein
MTDDSAALVAELRDAYDESLRALATYDRTEYELHYLKEGIEEEYDPGDIENIYDDVVLQDIQHAFHEDLFGDMGEVKGKLRLFEGGVVAHFWPTDESDGVFMVFDETADVAVWALYEFADRYYS